MVGLDDLRGLFQPMILRFYEMQRQRQRSYRKLRLYTFHDSRQLER